MTAENSREKLRRCLLLTENHETKKIKGRSVKDDLSGSKVNKARCELHALEEAALLSSLLDGTAILVHKEACR